MQAYPRPHGPMTGDELASYFAPERIACLICGRKFRALGTHIGAKHKMTTDEYREAYGIPWTRGLVSDASRETYRISSTMVMERDGNHLANHPNHVRPGAPRKHVPAVAKENYARIIRRNQETGPVLGEYGREDCFRFIERMAKLKKTPVEIWKQPGMPSKTTMYRWMRKDPEIKSAWREAVASLPFDKQASMESLGLRFFQAVVTRRLDPEGPFSDKKIAAELGVTAPTVNRFRQKHSIA